jgi:hypothetical protein
MQHPLEFFSDGYRKPLFFTFLFLTLALFAIFRVLDLPLRTPAAPNGIVSFEMARTPQQAQAIIDAWTGRTTIYTDGENQNAVTIPRRPFLYNAVRHPCSIGLGIDCWLCGLAFTAFRTLLAAGRQEGGSSLLARW